MLMAKREKHLLIEILLKSKECIHIANFFYALQLGRAMVSFL